jgi:hypothetical protein
MLPAMAEGDRAMIEVVKAWGSATDDGLVRAAYTADWGGAVPVVILRATDWQAREDEREKMLALVRRLSDLKVTCSDCGREMPPGLHGCFNPSTGDDDCDGRPSADGHDVADLRDGARALIGGIE